MQIRSPDIADAVAEGLQRRARADDLEQAVYGFDALDELGLHPVIQRALSDAGYGVWPEQRYPGEWHRRNRSEGRRCDVVLTPDNRPLRDLELKQTLFDTPDAVDPQESYWLEIKTVAQYETSGPFARYSSELLTPVTQDLKKLWTDGLILHAGLLLVLFTAERQTAEHDLFVWHRCCLDRGIPAAAPAARFFAISDRIGNAWCAAAVFAVRGG